MVKYLLEDDFYRRGCNDGTSLILGLVSLCATVALIITNYFTAWPVYMPVLEIVAAIANMATFSSNPVLRFKHVRVIYTFIAIHALCVVSLVVYMALLVTQTPLFLSVDCEACAVNDWKERVDDEFCSRAYRECSGLGKYRFGIFVLFPLSAASLVMELVNLATAALALVYLRKELAAKEEKKKDQ